MTVQVHYAVSADSSGTGPNSRSCGPLQMPRPFQAFELESTTQIAPSIRSDAQVCRGRVVRSFRTVPLPASAHLEPLPLSACAHAPTHTRMRPNMAHGADRGVRRYTRRQGHPSATSTVRSAMHCRGMNVVSETRIRVWGSSDDSSFSTSSWNSCQTARAFILMRRVRNRLSERLFAPRCQGSRFAAQGGRAMLALHGVWHVLCEYLER